MDLLQNRRFLSCKMSYHIRRTTCARLARRFPLHNKFINPHLLCLGFLFQLSLLKHQSERYHEKDARTPYRPDSELRHGKRTKSSTECEQRDDAKVTFRSEPRPPTAAGQGEKRRSAPCRCTLRIELKSIRGKTESAMHQTPFAPRRPRI